MNLRKLVVGAAVLGLAAAGVSTLAMAQEAAQPIPRSPGLPFKPKGIPDRVVLTAGADPSREMAVAWRTDPRQASAEIQLAEAIDGPSLEFRAKTLSGVTKAIDSANGPALYHQARLTGLSPDTAYVYRVKGAEGWSEWLQFHTAAATFRPFRFLYLGDTQNGILPIGSRVIRQGFQSTAAPALVLHAGDLVAQRDDLDHDDEWGEWTAAGAYNFSTFPQLPATGNHEYVDVTRPDGTESRKLGPYWPLQFALPANGAEPVKETTYYVDYQGVRFIILDGTAALDLGALEAQTRWLDQTQAASKAKWNIVTFHQPIFTCARPQDTEKLKAAWKPVFEARKVDLVLQGHDHCYARLTSEAGKADAASRHAAGKPQGPVYVVSVVGSKMYALNDRALTQPDKVAADTEFYQVIDVAADKLGFAAYTASGKLYDAFTLQRAKDGSKTLVESKESMLAQRVCNGATGPDGAPCLGRAK